jgi:hypothetical protein
LIITGAAILWNSLVLKSTKIALFCITWSVPISLPIYQITFDNDTNSKTAEESKFWNNNIFHTHIFGRKPKQYFRRIVEILKNGWSRTEKKDGCAVVSAI